MYDPAINLDEYRAKEATRSGEDIECEQLPDGVIIESASLLSAFQMNPSGLHDFLSSMRGQEEEEKPTTAKKEKPITARDEKPATETDAKPITEKEEKPVIPVKKVHAVLPGKGYSWTKRCPDCNHTFSRPDATRRHFIDVMKKS
jgi:hypothetical protein